jgi:hypothetical protein
MVVSVLIFAIGLENYQIRFLGVAFSITIISWRRNNRYLGGLSLLLIVFVWY